MKFGKQLEEYEVPEWKGHYLPYNELKKQLEQLVAKPASRTSSVNETPVDTPRTADRKSWNILGGGNGGVGVLAKKGGSFSGSLPSLVEEERVAVDEDTPGDWLRRVESETMRIGDFVERGIQGLELQLKDLAKMTEELRFGRDLAEDSAIDENASAEEEASFLELRVLQAVGRVSEGVQRLRAFAELNHAALYKILKKHDKLLKNKHGLGVLFPQLVKVTRLSDISRLDALAADVKKLSKASSKTEDIDVSPEVARLIAGLGRSGMTSGGGTFHSGQHRRSELVLAFFLGSSVALFLAIGVLLALPEKNPKTYSEAYFLTPIPVFRVVFSFLLILWCMGAVAKTCDQWDINHMFILSIDPRCRVTPQFFFARAAALTTCWILIFGMYVVDYKWRVLPTIYSDAGFNKRASLHFVLYPVSLLLLTIIGMVYPSTICRNRYKTSVVKSVKRTAMAPLYPVDFADNMVGDVLTSIAKPLQDVPGAVCYLLSHHPQEAELVERFVTEGDTCSHTTHRLALPLIAGLPFLFRALQCVRRYQDTKECRHLWNLGKYLCSLLVVIVSRMQDTPLLILVSTIATVYAFLWDVCLDWGLGVREFLGEQEPEGKNVDSESQQLPQRKPSKMTHPVRHFPKKVYWCCSLLDLFARSTWVFTLMPTTILSGDIVYRVIAGSAMSSIEIVRRSTWAVLRIEYEQISNASGFRALLWVPSKLNAPANAGTATASGTGTTVSDQRQSRERSSSLDLKQPLMQP